MRRICVYCGSSPGARPSYAAAARELGTTLARRGVGLVYGGGCVGLMGIVADATLEAGGEVDGVIPQHLLDKELGHRDLTRLHVVKSMHERKALMADLSDAFIALPGGLGTLEELAEVATWTQLGLQAKPVALLDVDGYWAPLVALLDRAVGEQFLRPEHRRVVLQAGSVAQVLEAVATWTAPPATRWLDRETR